MKKEQSDIKKESLKSKLSALNWGKNSVSRLNILYLNKKQISELVHKGEKVAQNVNHKGGNGKYASKVKRYDRSIQKGQCLPYIQILKRRNRRWSGKIIERTISITKNDPSP